MTDIIEVGVAGPQGPQGIPGPTGPPDTGAVAAHAALTTSVHGIADTSLLAKLPNVAENHYYVSTHGNDSNDGLTWGSAKATAASALAAAGQSPSIIEFGHGVFNITTPDAYGNGISIGVYGTTPSTVSNLNYGTVLKGQGLNATFLETSCDLTAAVAAYTSTCQVENLAIQVNSHTVQFGVLVDAPFQPGVAGMPSIWAVNNCSIRNVTCAPALTGVLVNGFGLGSQWSGGQPSVATCDMYHIVANNCTNAGVTFGGPNCGGNVLVNTIFGGYLATCAYGILSTNADFRAYGIGMGYNGFDVCLNGFGGFDNIIQGCRSENSAALLKVNASSVAQNVSIRDYDFTSSITAPGKLNPAGGYLITMNQGGVLKLDNVSLRTGAFTDYQPCIIVSSGYDDCGTHVIADGLTTTAPLAQLFSGSHGSSRALVTGYTQLPASGSVAHPFLQSITGPTLLQGQSAAQASFNGTSRYLMLPVTGGGATASRPSASTVTVGAPYFDTTLGIPIWSTGSAWVNSAGVAV